MLGMRTCGACVGVLVLMAGCGESRTPEQTAAALGAEISAARAQVQTAAEKGDGKGAKRRAEEAKAALAKLEALAIENPAPGIDLLVEPARKATKEAADIAGLAENRQYVADHCSSIKARAYRGAEGLAIRAFCEAGALACDQANKAPAESLPGPVRKAAQSAAEFDRAFTGRAPRADGTPEYAAIAANLRKIGTTPPAELHLVLAASHVVSGSPDLALVEIQQVDPATVSKDLKFLVHVERMAIYRLNRLEYLAREETATATAAGQDVAWFTPEVQASMHLVLAVDYIQGKRYKEADLEIARATQLDPNNPITVFLTGERLLADGKREEAARSLEKSAAGKSHAWVAEAVAERVRQLRDSSAPAEPILLSGPFLRSVIVHYLKEGSSEGARLVGGLVTDMQAQLEAAVKGSGQQAEKAETQPGGR